MRKKATPAGRGFAGCLFAAMLILQGCNSSPGAKDDTGTASAAAPPKTAPASIAPLPSQSNDQPFIATGPITVEHQVDVLTQRAGVVKEILVDVGTPVVKGTMLAVLDQRELTAQRDAADAKVRSSEADLKDWEAETKVAEIDYKRTNDMWKAGITSQQEADHARYKFEGSQYEVEKAQRNLENAKDDLRVAEMELDKSRIEAPFNGVVARRYVRAGQEVATGDRMFWVSELAPLRVRFTLAERYIGEVKKGATLYVSSVLAPGTSYPAKVVEVSPVLDPASDTVDVMAELEGAPKALQPGMTAHISLTASTRQQ